MAEESKRNESNLPKLSNKYKSVLNKLFKNHNIYEYYDTLLTILEENIEQNFNKNNISNIKINKLLSNHLHVYVNEYENIQNRMKNSLLSTHLSQTNYNNLMTKIEDSIKNLTKIIKQRQNLEEKYMNNYEKSLLNNSNSRVNYNNVDD